MAENETVNAANTEPAKKAKKERRTHKIKVGQVIAWIVIFILFLIITNPALLWFLPDETKSDIQGTWMRIFGDVTKISSTFQFSWATIFQVIAIILLMIVLTTVISFILDHVKPKSPKAKSTVTLFRSAIKYITFIVGFFWCLGALGVNLSTIFASVGIVALIIGFGAQSLVEDLVTGIFLVFEDQFNVGDIIEVSGFRGTVESIGIRTTAIRDIGNNVKIINNSDLRNVLNRSTAASYAVTTVGISYNTDLEKAEKAIDAILTGVKEKYPNLFLSVPKYTGVQELADSGVILKFVAEVREENVFSAPRILNRELKIGFDKAGIEIPFNQIVVHQAKD